jgi:hypothetical protein
MSANQNAASPLNEISSVRYIDHGGNVQVLDVSDCQSLKVLGHRSRAGIWEILAWGEMPE